MQCKTSAMCSASGDSESQIRPTLTGKEKNKSINQSNYHAINQLNYHAINQSNYHAINQSNYHAINQSNYHAINQSVIDSSYQPTNQIQSNNQITNIRAIQKKTLYLNFALAIRTLEQNKGYNTIGTVYLETQNNFVT